MRDTVGGAGEEVVLRSYRASMLDYKRLEGAYMRPTSESWSRAG